MSYASAPAILLAIVVSSIITGGWGFTSCSSSSSPFARRGAAFPSPTPTLCSATSTSSLFTLAPESEKLLSTLAETAESESAAGTAVAASSDTAERGLVLDGLVREAFDRLGQSEMRALAARTAKEEEEGAWAAVLKAVERETQRRMGEAKERLEELLEAGEINALDKQIVKLVKEGAIDAAFLNVLNQNMEDARRNMQQAPSLSPETGSSSSRGEALFNILNHVSTRVQEELEKRTEPAVALLHKLMRTDDSDLRGRILKHYLTPQREILLPDTTTLPLAVPKPSRVAPMKFASAVLHVVQTLRALDVNGDTVVDTVEQVRSVAKEARLVLLEDDLCGKGDPSSPVVAEFTDALTPAFQGGARAQ